MVVGNAFFMFAAVYAPLNAGRAVLALLRRALGLATTAELLALRAALEAAAPPLARAARAVAAAALPFAGDAAAVAAAAEAAAAAAAAPAVAPAANGTVAAAVAAAARTVAAAAAGASKAVGAAAAAVAAGGAGAAAAAGAAAPPQATAAAAAAALGGGVAADAGAAGAAAAAGPSEAALLVAAWGDPLPVAWVAGWERLVRELSSHVSMPPWPSAWPSVRRARCHGPAGALRARPDSALTLPQPHHTLADPLAPPPVINHPQSDGVPPAPRSAGAVRRPRPPGDGLCVRPVGLRRAAPLARAPAARAARRAAAAAAGGLRSGAGGGGRGAGRAGRGVAGRGGGMARGPWFGARCLACVGVSTLASALVALHASAAPVTSTPLAATPPAPAHPHTPHAPARPPPQAAASAARWALACAGLAGRGAKLALLLSLELGLFPLCVGFWLDVCALPLSGATLDSRVDQLIRAPALGCLVHYLLGVGFMLALAFGLVVARQVLRPGALPFIRVRNARRLRRGRGERGARGARRASQRVFRRAPSITARRPLHLNREPCTSSPRHATQDPTAPGRNPLKELMDTPLPAHAAHAALSAAVYACLGVVTVHLPARAARAAAPGLFPLRAQLLDPLAQVRAGRHASPCFVGSRHIVPTLCATLCDPRACVRIWRLCRPRPGAPAFGIYHTLNPLHPKPGPRPRRCRRTCCSSTC